MNRHLALGKDVELPAPRRLLVLSPFAPRLDASMGGPRIIAQLVQTLAERERVALLYLRGSDEPPLDECVRAACEVTVGTHRSGSDRRPRSLVAVARCAVRGMPSWVDEWCEPRFLMTLKAFATAWQPEIVQAEFHIMGQYLPALDRCHAPKVLNQHEPGVVAAVDRRRAGLLPGHLVPRFEVRAWRDYERRLVHLVDAIVTFTERDRQAMRQLGAPGHIEVIAPGAIAPASALDPLGQAPPALLFFGNYAHAPNVDAALRLGRVIFPRICAEWPDVQLWLIGDRAPDSVRDLASESIRIPGRVAELTPYLDRAAVVVVPLRLGGGMRVKVLEALGAGKAVVASRLATEGLDLVDGQHVLHAESDEEFVQQVLQLLRRPQERVALAQAARAWALQHLSWERAGAQYSALYDALLARGTRSLHRA